MQGHLDRLHRKINRQKARIEELEEGGDPVSAKRSSPRVWRSAFLHAVIRRGEPLDVETAWDLANIRGFLDATKVDDDGNVEGMEDALERVLERYPWLADEPPYDPDEDDEEIRLVRAAPRGLRASAQTQRRSSISQPRCGNVSRLWRRRRADERGSWWGLSYLHQLLHCGSG